MNPKRERFCYEYVECGNGRMAYQRVYTTASTKTAEGQSSKLLKMPEVQEKIKEINEEIACTKIMSLNECLITLTEFARDETASKTERMKAIELRLKTLGAFLERQQVETTTNIVVSIEE